MSLVRQIKQDSPIAYWILDEISGSAFDQVGTHPATKNGTVTQASVSFFDGRSYADFAGGYFQAADAADLSPQVGATGQITVEVWAKLDTLATTTRLVGKASAGYEWELFVRSSGAADFVTYYGGGANCQAVIAAGSAVTTGVWHQIVGVANRATPIIATYVDGVLQGSSSAATSTSTDTTDPVDIGRRGDGAGTSVDGALAHIAIYPTALSPERIKAHYQAGVRSGVVVGPSSYGVRAYRGGLVYFASAAAPTYPVSGDFTGTGTLTGALIQSRRLGTGDLSGTGTLTGSLSVVRAITGDFSGTGTLSGGLRRDWSVAGDFSGTGSLSGSITVNPPEPVSGTFSGTGTLTGLVNKIKQVTGLFTGNGTLAGVLNKKRQLTGDFSGTGTLTGAVTLDGSPVIHGLSASFSGEGFLYWASTGTPSIDGAFSGEGNLDLDPTYIEFQRNIVGVFTNETFFVIEPSLLDISRSQFWWNDNYTYRRVIDVEATPTGLPEDHPITSYITKAIIRQGKARTDGADIEVLRLADIAPERWVVIDKEIEILDDLIRVTWNNGYDIAPGMTLGETYYIYYGNQSLTDAPEVPATPTFHLSEWPVEVLWSDEEISYTRPGEHWIDNIAQEELAKASIYFYGDQIRVFADTGPQWGMAEVQIDNGPWEIVDLHYFTDALDTVVYTATGLSKGMHYLRYRMSGRKNPAADDFKINLTKIQYEKFAVGIDLGEEADETLMWSSALGGTIGG